MIKQMEEVVGNIQDHEESKLLAKCALRNEHI